MSDPDRRKLEDVGARLKALQDAAAEKKTKEQERHGAALSAGVGFRIGIELIAGVLVGGALGFFIDREFDTRPIFMLAFIALGFAASLMSVLRILKNLDQAVGLGRAIREKEAQKPPPSPKGREDEDD